MKALSLNSQPVASVFASHWPPLLQRRVGNRTVSRVQATPNAVRVSSLRYKGSVDSKRLTERGTQRVGLQSPVLIRQFAARDLLRLVSLPRALFLFSGPSSTQVPPWGGTGAALHLRVLKASGGGPVGLKSSSSSLFPWLQHGFPLFRLRSSKRRTCLHSPAHRARFLALCRSSLPSALFWDLSPRLPSHHLLPLWEKRGPRPFTGGVQHRS